MEEKPKSVAMNGITYGIITGVVMILFNLILYLFDLHLNTKITWIAYVILVGGMIWGTLDYRKKVLNGFMSYGKAFSTSLMIVLFASILVAIYTFLFFQVIAPDAVQDVIELSRQSALERDPEITDEQLEQGMQMFSFIMTPIGMAISGMLSQLITGAVISLITSIFLKKEDKSMTSSAI
ncbi:MAG: DUF4199 domain-containing protein [Bacteroidota bacterium]